MKSIINPWNISMYAIAYGSLPKLILRIETKGFQVILGHVTKWWPLIGQNLDNVRLRWKLICMGKLISRIESKGFQVILGHVTEWLPLIGRNFHNVRFRWKFVCRGKLILQIESNGFSGLSRPCDRMVASDWSKFR